MKVNLKILDIKPHTRQEDGKMVEGDVKFNINGFELWALTQQDWRSGWWSFDMIGKEIECDLRFNNFITKKIETPEKTIIHNHPIPHDPHYIIRGEILEKFPSPLKDDNSERGIVDCGVIFDGIILEREYGFEVGDFVESEGYLGVVLFEKKGGLID